MKNWRYINGAEGIKIGNYGVSLDSAGARQVREMAAKLWTSGMHNSRDIAMAIAFEIAKTSKAMQENKADVVSNIQDIIDRWIKEVKTGNDTLAEYAKRPPKIVGGNSLPEELEKDVEKKDKEKVDDGEELKKTGNAKDKNDKDLKVGDFVNVTGKKGKVTKIIGDVVEVFFDNSGTYYPDRTDRYYASECTKIGNSKTGNVQYHKVGKITIRLEANDDDWTVYDDNGHELRSGKGGLGRAKYWAEHFARFINKRTGNEASDDKFAYVMREFDEGNLKTPDGKVVTDPAQAKAIAYSESKKTENGLARARNAMNKKTGNSKKEYSGKYIDIYDSGEVVVKEGWAFGERFNKSNFGSWINNEIQAKEKTLQECKKMKAEFEKNFI